MDLPSVTLKTRESATALAAPTRRRVCGPRRVLWSPRS